MTMSCDDAGTSGVQRFEVFTGAGRRRDRSKSMSALIDENCVYSLEHFGAEDMTADQLIVYSSIVTL